MLLFDAYTSHADVGPKKRRADGDVPPTSAYMGEEHNSLAPITSAVGLKEDDIEDVCA